MTILHGCMLKLQYSLCPHMWNQDSGISPVLAADMALAEERELLMKDAARAESDLCTEELGAHTGQSGQEAGPAGPGPGPAAGPEPSLQRSLRLGPCLAGRSACQSRMYEQPNNIASSTTSPDKKERQVPLSQSTASIICTPRRFCYGEESWT